MRVYNKKQFKIKNYNLDSSINKIYLNSKLSKIFSAKKAVKLKSL